MGVCGVAFVGSFGCHVTFCIDRMSEDRLERMPDRMSGDMPERMSEIMSEDMSERMSKDMSDFMSEDCLQPVCEVESNRTQFRR